MNLSVRGDTVATSDVDVDVGIMHDIGT